MCSAIWEASIVKFLGEYSGLYIETSVLLLYDVFRNYRKLYLQVDKLDLHAEIDSCVHGSFDMFLFVERGIRVGIYFSML